jgi:uncharacterized protein (DUF305 family)
MKMETMGNMQRQKIMTEAQAVILRGMADVEKAKKSGVSLSFTGEQMAQYPQLNQLYQSLIQHNEADIQQMMTELQPSPQAQGQPPQAPQGGSGGGVPTAQQAVPAAA